MIVSCFAAQPVLRTTITVKLRGPVQASVSGWICQFSFDASSGKATDWPLGALTTWPDPRTAPSLRLTSAACTARPGSSSPSGPARIFRPRPLSAGPPRDRKRRPSSTSHRPPRPRRPAGCGSGRKAKAETAPPGLREPRYSRWHLAGRRPRAGRRPSARSAAACQRLVQRKALASACQRKATQPRRLRRDHDEPLRAIAGIGCGRRRRLILRVGGGRTGTQDSNHGDREQPPEVTLIDTHPTLLDRRDPELP